MRPLKHLQHAFATLPLIAVLASCQKQDDSAPATRLTLRQELEFSIPPGQEGDLDLTTLFDARTSVSRLLEEKGFSMDQLEDVRISDARALFIEPANTPFNSFAKVRLDLAQSAGSPLTFAHLEPVPMHQDILDLFVVHADLTSFFQGEARTIHARMETNQRIADGTARMRFVVTFSVKVAGQ